MAIPEGSDRAIRYLRSILGWFLIVAFLTVASTGALLFIEAQGMHIAAAHQRFLRMAKWHILDIHVIFGLLLAVSAVVYALARRVVWLDAKRLTARRRFFQGMVSAVVAGMLSAVLVSTVMDKHPVLVHDVRATDYPATRRPDQVVLTWSDDPRTTQTIQWRTAPEVVENLVRYRRAGSPATEPWTRVSGHTAMLEDPYLGNDPLNARHTVVLDALAPATEYVYQVGADGTWTTEADFTTAPAGVAAFSFVYMGDIQTGFEGWGNLAYTAYRRHPEAAFYIVAGDLVNNGCDRNEWDALFHAAQGIFSRRPLVPAIGNHDDCDEAGPWMYLELLALPENGPEDLEPERVYSFEYADALFVVLDSNLPVSTQTAWLERQLQQSETAWKFVVCHHPVYVSKPHRENEDIREQWRPLFDAYNVDIVFQGHDHAYLRTHPLRDGARAAGSERGVIYVISIAGDKYYEQMQREYTAVGMEEVSTYQTIAIDGRRLVYQAYDPEGRVVDEFTIRK